MYNLLTTCTIFYCFHFIWTVALVYVTFLFSQKNGHSFIEAENPDIFAVHETKCSLVKLPSDIKNIDGYHSYWVSAEKEGYSGVGLYSKTKPIDVKYGIGMFNWLV